MLMNTMTLNYVWQQSQIPVVMRTGAKGEKLEVKLPFSADNRAWLKTCGKSEPEWSPIRKRWLLPQNWLNAFVEQALHRFGKLYVIQPYREQERCAPACWNATGHDCQCSCMGANHGAGEGDGWFVVSDHFATRWGSKSLACRLMVKR